MLLELLPRRLFNFAHPTTNVPIDQLTIPHRPKTQNATWPEQTSLRQASVRFVLCNFTDLLSLAPTPRQKTVWEHYNEISRYIDVEREREWGDVADSTLVFVSKYDLHL